MASFVLGMLASIFSVLLAVPVAIFIVERYLERRRREAAERAELEERRYAAGWSIYLHGGIVGIAGLLINISLFVAHGKEKYSRTTQKPLSEVPEPLGSFMTSLIEEFGRSLAEPPEETTDKSKGWNKEHATSLTSVFQERPAARDFTARDVMLLIGQLQAMQVFLQHEMYLLIPYMPRHMGIASALTDVDRYLGRAIDDARVASYIAPSTRDESKVWFSEHMLSAYCSLGQTSVLLRNMIGAGTKDLDLTVADAHVGFAHNRQKRQTGTEKPRVTFRENTI